MKTLLTEENARAFQEKRVFKERNEDYCNLRNFIIEFGDQSLNDKERNYQQNHSQIKSSVFSGIFTMNVTCGGEWTKVGGNGHLYKTSQ